MKHGFWASLVTAVAIVATAGAAQAGVIPIDGRGPITPREPVERPGRLSPVAGGVTAFPYGAEQLAGATYLGVAHLGNVSVDIAVQMRDQRGLLAYAQLASDPISPYYRRFLTPQQLADYFGASPAAYAATARYFQSYGLSVKGWTQRQLLWVSGSQDRMERAFGTHFGWYRKNGVTFYGPVTAPRVSVPIPIAGVGSMVTYRHLRRHFIPGGPARPLSGVSSSLEAGYSPFQIGAAFDYTGAYGVNDSCCKGDGIKIGIAGTGPISNGSNGDVPTYRNAFHVSGTGTLTQVNVSLPATGSGSSPCCSSGDAPAPPVTAPCTQANPPNYLVCNPEDVEAQLDTEQTTSLAPNASVLFYLAYNAKECFVPGPSTCGPSAMQAEGIQLTDDELQQAINDNQADILSLSFGLGEPDAYCSPPAPGCALNVDGTGFEPAMFASLAAEGIAVFISSGDSGAEECMRDGGPNADKLCVSWPADDVDVVSVGGTTTPIGANGRLDGIVATWGYQTNQGFGAGGGGISELTAARPAWQPTGQFCSIRSFCNGPATPRRLQPDLSLNADPVTGVAVIINAGVTGAPGPQIGPIGGTSAAAPDMAAMWALVLEACKQQISCSVNGGLFGSSHSYRLGNPAPLLYRLSAAQRQAAFMDIAYGSIAQCNSTVGTFPCPLASLDDGFVAGPGYDLATGLGAPFARNLIKAVTGL